MTVKSEQPLVMAERDSRIESMVVGLLDVAMVLRRAQHGVEVECKLCGERDDNHTNACPVPALEEWLNPSDCSDA